MKILSVFLVIGLFFISVQAQNKLSNKDLEAIKQIEKNFESAFLKNDQKEALSLFWEDAMIYPNGNTFKGISAIKTFFFPPSDTVTHTLSKYEIKLEEIYGEKNLAYSIGTHDIAWTATTKEKSDVQKFTATRYFMAVYTKRDNQWKIYKRHWSGKLQEVK
jgi:uncharacterized protein (TIGR02246 family)